MATDTVNTSLVPFLSSQLLNPMNHNLPVSVRPMLMDRYRSGTLGLDTPLYVISTDVIDEEEPRIS